MPRLPLPAVALAAASLTFASAAPASASANPAYIVTLQPDVDVTAVVADHARRYGVAATSSWRRAMTGYAAAVPASRLDDLARDPRVDRVEPDRAVHAAAKAVVVPAPQSVPWGIARVGATSSSALAGDGAGTVTGVNVHVVDSGIAAHADLDAATAVNFAGGKATDCSGHGTHVAGTLGARDNAQDVVGVSPGVRLTGVKVLDCTASGSVSDVIAGIEWVTATAPRTAGPDVANLSATTPASDALDAAVRGSVAAGVLYVVSAGNQGVDACGVSPARAGAGAANGIVTVGATDAADQRATFSNHGSCVDVWAPGVAVTSTARGGGTLTMSGTSMAAPHVSGAGVLLRRAQPSLTPPEVERVIVADAAPSGIVWTGRY